MIVGVLDRSAGLGDLRAALDANDRLLARHLGAAVQRLGAAALEVIDLPPLTTGSIDAEQIRVAAVLLWAREVEAAGLPSFVEALAEGLVHGRLMLPVTSGGDRLMRYYRARSDRFGPEERAALYARLFGDSGGPHQLPEQQFALLFEQLIGMLDDIGRAGDRQSLSAMRARLRIVGRELAELLSASAGIAAFAARDIVAHIREAADIMHDADVSQALGGGGLWTMIRANSVAITGRTIDPAPHLTRASAGQQILTWLADTAAAPGAAEPAVERGDPVVEAAQAWLLTPAA
jgi:hypothetical protein